MSDMPNLQKHQNLEVMQRYPVNLRPGTQSFFGSFHFVLTSPAKDDTIETDATSWEALHDLTENETNM